MSFENPTNRGRALKIVEILAHVEKSAKSNRATPDEITLMCAPVVEMLRSMGALPPAITLAQEDLTAPPEAAERGAEPSPELLVAIAQVQHPNETVIARTDRETPLSAATVPGGKWAADRNAPAWAIIGDAAKCAPLQDLAAAMAVYASRVDDALFELKGERA